MNKDPIWDITLKQLVYLIAIGKREIESVSLLSYVRRLMPTANVTNSNFQNMMLRLDRFGYVTSRIEKPTQRKRGGAPYRRFYKATEQGREHVERLRYYLTGRTNAEGCDVERLREVSL